MFVSDDSLMGIVGVAIVLMTIQGNARNTSRRRKVEGSIHQYNISPTQTMWSTRFYTPKLRRLVLIIALAITIDSRAMDTPQKQTFILALHTSYTPKNHSGMNPLYDWLMRRHSRFKDGLHYLWICIPYLTTQTGRERHTTRTKIPHPKTVPAQRSQVRSPRFHPDPYLRHCFD